MTDASFTLSRTVSVARIPPTGLDVTVETDAAERDAIAAALGLPALHAFAASFRLTGTAELVRLSGRITARLEQICVVTLEAFETVLDEKVRLDFEAPERASERGAPAADLDPDRDIPDEIVGGRIDLGSVAQEFLALGLDPYPRKPGVAFETDADAESGSPFADLRSRLSERE